MSYSFDSRSYPHGVFGGGCFWGIEAAFREIHGVEDTTVGYAGGKTPNPTYKEVCSGATGHAEVCRVFYNPAVCSYEHLLHAFFKMHDPTQLNRQGPDIGSQYRSIILYGDEVQETAARLVRTSLTPRYPDAIVTEIKPAGEFWPAEAYHQRYLEKRRTGLMG
ncbi:MAG: peptide-methionine (S)-S-oxide reductase MsrA [Pseudomonadota bacterium]